MGIGIEAVVALLAGVTGLLVPLLRELVSQLRQNSLWFRKSLESQFGEALLKGLGVKTTFAEGGTAKLLNDLSSTAATMDKIVAEIAQLTQERQATITKLETDLVELSRREEELKGRIKVLENVPVPALMYFEEMLKKQERPTMRRDYVLFLAGVVVTSVITVLLKRFGLG
jgi:cell division protein FtsB